MSANNLPAKGLHEMTDRIYLGMLTRRHNMPLLLYSLTNNATAAGRSLNIQYDVWYPKENILYFPSLYLLWDKATGTLTSAAAETKFTKQCDNIWIRGMRLQSLVCQQFISYTALIPGSSLVFSIYVVDFNGSSHPSAPCLCEYTAIIRDNGFVLLEKSGSLELGTSVNGEGILALSEDFAYRQYNTEIIGLLPLSTVKTSPSEIEFFGKTLPVSETAIQIAKMYNCMYIPVVVTNTNLRVLSDNSTMMLNDVTRTLLVSKLLPLDTIMSPVKQTTKKTSDLYPIKNSRYVELPSVNGNLVYVFKRLVADVNVSTALQEMLGNLMTDYGKYNVSIMNAEGERADVFLESLLHDTTVSVDDRNLRKMYVNMSVLNVMPMVAMVAAPYAKLLQSAKSCFMLCTVANPMTPGDIFQTLVDTNDVKKDRLLLSMTQQVADATPSLGFWMKSAICPRDMIVVPLSLMGSETELRQIRAQIDRDMVAQLTAVYGNAIPPRIYVPNKNEAEKLMLDNSPFASHSSLFNTLHKFVNCIRDSDNNDNKK